MTDTKHCSSVFGVTQVFNCWFSLCLRGAAVSCCRTLFHSSAAELNPCWHFGLIKSELCFFFLVKKRLISHTCLGGSIFSFEVMKFCLGHFVFCLHGMKFVLQQNEENVQTKLCFSCASFHVVR